MTKRQQKEFRKVKKSLAMERNKDYEPGRKRPAIRRPAGLSPKQFQFVTEFMVDFNAFAAAKRAGYSDANASVAYKLVHKSHIQEEIQRRQKLLAEKVEAKQDEFITGLVRVFRGCLDMKQYLNEEGNLMSNAELAQKPNLIGILEVVEDFDRETGMRTRRRLKLRDPVAVAETVAKILGWGRKEGEADGDRWQINMIFGTRKPAPGSPFAPGAKLVTGGG